MQTVTPTRAGPAQTSPPSSRSRRRLASSLRIGYLLSRYPAVKHAFFLHEVLGLRAHGLRIETASLRPPDRPRNTLSPEEAAEAANTFYVKDGHSVGAFFKLLKVILTHPSAFFRGLGTVRSIPDLTLRHRLYWLSYLAEALLLGQWLRVRKLSSLHVHFGGAVASVGMLASECWRIPWSLTIHGPEELLNVDAYHLRQKIHSASFVFCISHFCRSQLFALTPPDQWHKFQVVRLGVDPVTLTPPSRHNSSISGPRSAITPQSELRSPEIVCIGSLLPAKGHRVLLESARLLRERAVPFRLTLIGTGPDLFNLKQFVARHDLSNTVHFASALSHPEALAHLRRADIFALASFAEGLPISLMEAMSLGIPCVATAIGGIPELIHSGSDGLLVPPSNATAFADALESLLLDVTLRRNLGSTARQRIIREYNLPLNHESLAVAFESQFRPDGSSARARQPR